MFGKWEIEDVEGGRGREGGGFAFAGSTEFLRGEERRRLFKCISTELAKKVCHRLRDLATAPAGGITQPRTNLFGQLSRHLKQDGNPI